MTCECNKKTYIFSIFIVKLEELKLPAKFKRITYDSYTYKGVSFKQMNVLAAFPTPSPYPFRLCCLFTTNAARLFTCVQPMTFF